MLTKANVNDSNFVIINVSISTTLSLVEIFIYLISINKYPIFI